MSAIVISTIQIAVQVGSLKSLAGQDRTSIRIAVVQTGLATVGFDGPVLRILIHMEAFVCMASLGSLLSIHLSAANLLSVLRHYNMHSTGMDR
jgi:hypothetical protein